MSGSSDNVAPHVPLRRVSCSVATAHAHRAYAVEVSERLESVAVADWQTISSLATAGGTLVLGIATFSAVRSSQRAARIAEQALLTGMRPLLVPSRPEDPAQKILWSDRHAVRLSGGRALIEEDTGVI